MLSAIDEYLHIRISNAENSYAISSSSELKMKLSDRDVELGEAHEGHSSTLIFGQTGEVYASGTVEYGREARGSNPLILGDQTRGRSDGNGTEQGNGRDISPGAGPKIEKRKDQEDDQEKDLEISSLDHHLPAPSNPVLFLSADILSNDSRSCTVNVGNDDLQTMQNLRKAYKTLGRSWIWKRPTGIKFYRVREVYPYNILPTVQLTFP